MTIGTFSWRASGYVLMLSAGLLGCPESTRSTASSPPQPKVSAGPETPSVKYGPAVGAAQRARVRAAASVASGQKIALSCDSKAALQASVEAIKKKLDDKMRPRFSRCYEHAFLQAVIRSGTEIAEQMKNGGQVPTDEAAHDKKLCQWLAEAHDGQTVLAFIEAIEPKLEAVKPRPHKDHAHPPSTIPELEAFIEKMPEGPERVVLEARLANLKASAKP